MGILSGAVGESTELSAGFTTSKPSVTVDHNCTADEIRYFHPAEEVLPDQIITGVGCSAGEFVL